MTTTSEIPATPAVHALRQAGIDVIPHFYDYVEKGGTQRSSAMLGVPEHQVVKTLVFETEAKKPFVVLMHGDRQVSAKAMARMLGVKGVRACDPQVAERHTGYMVGGTSPFGMRKALPLYVQQTILDLPWVLVNGGRRGFLVRVDPVVFTQVLGATPVEAATDK